MVASETELAFSLALNIRMFFRTLKRHVHEQGGQSGLSAAQISVVLRLEKDGLATVSSLARAEGMRPQSMSAVMAPLQQSGLVRGTADPSDGRQTLMGLTPKCFKLLEEGRAARQDWLTGRIAQKLSAAEQKQLQSALELLTKLVEG